MGGGSHPFTFGFLETVGEFQREEQVGGLRLSVGAPGVVRLLPLRVVPVDVATQVGDTGDGHNSGVVRQQRVQFASQGEVAEVVSAELGLKSLFGGMAFWQGHNAGVVEQEVDLRNSQLA